MSENPKMTTVKVVRQEQYDSGPFNFGAEFEDGTLKAVIDSLLAIRESIPAEHRDSARCGIEAEGSYEGSCHATISVSYERPETGEEAAARIAKRVSADEQARQRELATLAALRAKYPGAA